MSMQPAAAEAFPVSYAQELLFLLDRAAPGLTAYNISKIRRVRGIVDVAALQRSFDAIVARHEILRTTYAFDGDRPIQVIGSPRPVPLKAVDLTALPPTTREEEALRLARESIRTPFDLARDVLLRATLFMLGDSEAFLLLETHHIVSDGWSSDVMFRELAELYDAYRRGAEPSLPALPIQYADFAIWQREHLAGERLDALLSYWRESLGDADTPLLIPTDFPRGGPQTFVGAQQTLVLDAAQTAAIKALAQRHDVTLYMVLLAAYQAVLHRWTGQRDVLVGSPIAGRALPETQGLIGYFANTLVLRSKFAPEMTFGDLLAQVRDTALNGFEHQDVPLEKLVLELREGQDRLNPAPLFQVVLTMLDTSNAPLALPGVSLDPVTFQSGATKFDFTLFFADRQDGLRLTLSYRTDMFRAATAERFLGHVRSALLAAAADATVSIARAPLLAEAERAALAGWNATDVDEGTPATAVSLFEQRVAEAPARPALVASSAAGVTTLSYADLNMRANRLAHHLRRIGARPGVPVGLLLDRSADAIAGLLGILKAGGAYVPLSVDAPASRLVQQLAECQATIVVTDSAHAALLPQATQRIVLDEAAAVLGQERDDNPVAATGPDALAYILYTSGSTGIPKGVAVSNANIVHYARAISRVFADVPPAARGDGFASLAGWTFGMVSTLAADLGNTSLYPALLGGGTLCLLDAAVTTDPAKFAAFVREQPLDVLKITPNHWHALVASRKSTELAGVAPKRWLVFGGEALRPDALRPMLANLGCRILNHYGPTETTVGVCTNEVTADSLDAALDGGARTVPVGRPLANTRAFVVDGYGNEQAVGIPGELLLGGAGVATGYYRRPELTAERFVEFAGERVYRTGDQARRLPGGSVEFLGRLDSQVKIRGYRVELGEIEQALLQHPGIAAAVAMLREDVAGDPRLVLYAVAKQAGYAVSHADRPSGEKLIDWLAAQLLGHMVPTVVVLLDSLPLTANGKVDRAKLPAPGEAGRAEIVAPATETERALVQIWADALKRDPSSFGTTDDFLALGGHSLVAIRVLGKISRTFGLRLPLRTLFDAPQIVQLAELVDLERQLAALGSAEPGQG